MAALAAVTALAVAGCDTCPPNSPESCSNRPKNAETWYQRAKTAFKGADFEDAHDSAAAALAIVPEDGQVKLLAAHVALASLDYAEVLRLLKGMPGTEAAQLRGRALWYKGELDAAADELDAMLTDPSVKDEWAKSTTKLARRGAGRTPFVLSGGLLAAVDMIHVSPVAPYFVVPIEIDGEGALALVATGVAEVVLDSAQRPEPSWVSLRFGERFEVHDVPALAQDLSGVSKELGAPIKALLGVNLLRHLNTTIDFSGRQFVARSFVPPPPPSATRLPLHYVRGGGLVVQSQFGGEKGAKAALVVDTRQPFPIALDAEGWQKAGVDVASLKPLANDPEKKLREGTVPLLRLGAFDVPQVTGLFGIPLTELEQAFSVDLDGIVGAGLLYQYRCTFADGGRLLWIEDDAASMRLLQGAPALPPPGPAAPPLPQPKNQSELPAPKK